MLRNARQIRAVVTAAFPSFETAPLDNCGHSSGDIGTLACNWKGLMDTLPNPQHARQDIELWLLGMTKVCYMTEPYFKTNSQQWLSQAQEIMSSTASNYDTTKLAVGIAVAGLSFLFALSAAAPIISTSLTATSPILIISLLYSIMMFASSYVEEEQNFWYWSTSTWLFILYIKRFPFPLPYPIHPH